MEHLGEEGRGVSRAAARATRSDATPPTSSRLTLKPKRNRRVAKGGRAIDVRAIADACGRALRRSLSTIIALIAIAAIGGTAWAGYHFVTTSSRFAIDTIDIRGASRLDPARLRADLPVHVGDNVFTASPGAIVAQLRANPWIESVDARRVLPHAIVVELRERVPVAVVELDSRYLVDATGHPFKRADADDGAGLPLVTGLPRASYLSDPDGTARSTQRALAALTSWRARAERPLVDEVRVSPRGTLAFVVAGGPTIELGRGDADLAARFAAFDATWASLGETDRARAAEIRVGGDRVTVGFVHH
jgi:cell division protein FtsQ